MEHALSAITVLGIVLGVTLSLIPDDFFGKILLFLKTYLTEITEIEIQFPYMLNYCKSLLIMFTMSHKNGSRILAQPKLKNSFLNYIR